MVFLLFLFFTMLLFSWMQKKESEPFYPILFVLYGIVWTLIVGGQYNVGTDYFSYYEMFSFPDIRPEEDNREFVFSFLITQSKDLFDNPTATFFLIAGINVCVLYGITKCFPIEQRWLYLFLLIVVSTAFNNQFNIVRQYFATFVLSSGILYLYKERHSYKKIYYGGIMLILSAGIHHSAIWGVGMMLGLYLLSFVRFKKWSLLIISLAACLIPFLSSVMIFTFDLMESTGNTHYLNHAYVVPIPLKEIILKLFYLVFVLLAIFNQEKLLHTSTERRMFVIGVLAFAIRIMCLATTITNRFGMFFELIMIIPILYYLSYLRYRHRQGFYLVMLGLIAIYTMKVTIFASGEYAYQSIFFN